MIRHNARAVGHLIADGLPGWIVRNRTYVLIRRLISATPQRFEPPDDRARPFSPEDWRERKLASPSTDLCIEGFPGSANTFVSNSVRDAIDRPANVESHFHYTVQLKRAICFGVPAVVLVRDPRGACGSLKSKEPDLLTCLILMRWIVYHRFVLRRHGCLHVFLFEDVVEDPDLLRRNSDGVRRLVARPIAPNPSYQLPSAANVGVEDSSWWTAGLLRVADQIYDRLHQVALRDEGPASCQP